jgi:hypothetical protein
MRDGWRGLLLLAVLAFFLAGLPPLYAQEAGLLFPAEETLPAAAVLLRPAAAGMSGFVFDAPALQPLSGQAGQEPGVGGPIPAAVSPDGALKEKPSFKKVLLWASLGTGVTALSLSYLFWYLGERAENIYLDVSSIERANRLRVAAYRNDILSLIFAGVSVLSFCVSFPLVASNPASF